MWMDIAIFVASVVVLSGVFAVVLVMFMSEDEESDI